MLLLLAALLLQTPHDKVIEDALKFLKTAPDGEKAAVARELDRCIPNRASLKPYLADGGELGVEGRKFLAKQAALLGAFAQSELDRKRPVTAGMEAFRALGLDASCDKAGKVLLYFEGRHLREADLRKQGLAKTEWGWIAESMAKAPKAGCVPDESRWVEEPASDKAHAKWDNARELKFTHVTVKSDLPMAQVADVGRRVDWFIAWLRARFCRIDGYAEPAWPVNLWIPAAEENYSTLMAQMTSEGSPFGICFYPTKPFVLVNGPNCREKSFEGIAGIAQHETSHAFFALAFKGRGAMPNTPYGWMMEAFPAYCYYVSPERPIDGDFWRKLKQKYVDPERKKELDRITSGEDVLGKLNKLAFAKAKDEVQAYLAGAVLAMYALENADVREKYGQFVTEFFSWRAGGGDFEKALGPSPVLSRKIAEWLAKQPE